ncbi:hypothetical protein MMAG44476_38115 [Mycolicibacterium mageritense DSM 44476 = CIP 104973]|uniref:Uncharacterized protein n=1 Tax=Mycolicibacterium mageritense TaxID=53462 RepID=A0ABN5YIV9_MYCME|nr:hypothetical protein MMAGJ_72990 [Mycolicibacterium mageritense]
MTVSRGWADIEASLRRELALLGVSRITTYEKYGTLRIETNLWNAEVEATCDRAQERSSVTCENCGRPGRARTLPGGWVKTLCDQCPGVEGAVFIRDRPGWRVRVEQLVQDLDAIEPGARVQMVSPSLRGPQAVFTTTTEAGRAAVFAALNDLRLTCGRCGRVQENETTWRREFWCPDCRGRER